MVNFEEHEKLVWEIYHRNFYGYPYLKDDLIQCGTIALWKASKGFDETKGLKFSSYAVPAIRREMLRYVLHEKKHFNNLGSDFLPLEKGKEDDIFQKILVEQVIDKCVYKKSIKERIKKLYQGYTIKDLAEMENKTRQAISKTNVENREMIKEMLLNG